MRSALFIAVFAVVAGRGGCAPDEPPAYDPCAGKSCDELCDPCAPGEPCPLYFAAHACDPAGECVTVGTFTCEPPPPCLGKACGDDCVIDPPCAPLCMMPSMLGSCDPSGACQPASEVKCDPPPPPVDPCADKRCGDACATCDPTAGVCAAVMMYCDASGACGYPYPVCSAP